MADISYNQKEELEDSDEGMEIKYDDDIDDNQNPDDSSAGMWSSMGGGDEREQDKQLIKLQQCATSAANFTRQRVGRILLEIFRTAVHNGTKVAINEVMQSVQQIINDPEAQVRADLVEQLPHIAMICQEAPDIFGDVLHDHLLDIIINYLEDGDPQVRLMANAAILTLTKRGLLDSKTIEHKICPEIEKLSHKTVEFLPSAVTLMSKMAPLIGTELTEKVFLDRFIDHCQDQEFYVRKTCASHFGEFCAAVKSKTFCQRMLPIFVELCGDSFWGVRKACVDVMMPVSCCLTLQHRRFVLAGILATHLDDDSKWVRSSAFQILGPFISTFAKRFVDVTYNQQGEFVFTGKEDTRSSMSYSYEGLIPTKCEMRSHSFETEEDNWKEMIRLMPTNNVDKQDDNSKNEEEHITECEMRALKKKFNNLMVRASRLERSSESPVSNEVDSLYSKLKMTVEARYNPFLYYYIPPELPLDDELVEAAKKLATENNISERPTVRMFDMKSSNQLIKYNGGDIVPRHLIDSFLSMAVEPEQYSDMAHQCAFSFPAVVLTLGKENWPYLKEAYQALASANQWKVRRTLASSIHEIATILGHELTVADLVPIYNGFIRDLDEVRIGVLKHLATFLKILRPRQRCQYLPRLNEFLATDNEWNWRFREELATQLLAAVDLFSAADVERYIVGLALDLLSDKVAAVRHVALSLVTRIMDYFSDSESLVTTVIQELRSSHGVYAKKWIRRQTYAFVCSQLLVEDAIRADRFSQEMLPCLLKLSSDKVPNVRLAVARTLWEQVVNTTQLLNPEQMEEVQKRLEQMRLDPDRDVRVFAGGDEHLVQDVILTQNETEQSRNIIF